MLDPFSSLLIILDLCWYREGYHYNRTLHDECYTQVTQESQLCKCQTAQLANQHDKLSSTRDSQTLSSADKFLQLSSFLLKNSEYDSLMNVVQMITIPYGYSNKTPNQMQQSIVNFFFDVLSLLNIVSLTNRPRLRTLPPPYSYGNQRLQRQFDGLLMMGIVMPETC